MLNTAKNLTDLARGGKLMATAIMIIITITVCFTATTSAQDLTLGTPVNLMDATAKLDTASTKADSTKVADAEAMLKIVRSEGNARPYGTDVEIDLTKVTAITPVDSVNSRSGEIKTQFIVELTEGAGADAKKSYYVLTTNPLDDVNNCKGCAQAGATVLKSYKHGDGKDEKIPEGVAFREVE